MGRKSSAGFSLVELMVAGGIIGILMMLALPRYHAFMVKARRGEAKSNLSHLSSLQAIYKIDYFTYYRGPAMTGNNGIGYKDGIGRIGLHTCDPNNNLDEGLCNHLGFQPEAVNELRYFYQFRGGDIAIASAASDGDGKYIYPDCNGDGSAECNYASGDAMRLSISDRSAPEVCRNITKHCPPGVRETVPTTPSTTPTPTPTPTTTPPPPCNCRWVPGPWQPTIDLANECACKSFNQTRALTLACTGTPPCPIPTTRPPVGKTVQGAKPISSCTTTECPCEPGDIRPSCCPCTAPNPLPNFTGDRSNSYLCEEVQQTRTYTITCTPPPPPIPPGCINRTTTDYQTVCGTKTLDCADTNICTEWGDWSTYEDCKVTGQKANGDPECRELSKRSRTCTSPCTGSTICPDSTPSCLTSQRRTRTCSCPCDSNNDCCYGDVEIGKPTGMACNSGWKGTYDATSSTLGCCHNKCLDTNGNEITSCPVGQRLEPFPDCCVPIQLVPCTNLECCYDHDGDPNTLKIAISNPGSCAGDWKGTASDALGTGCCQSTPPPPDQCLDSNGNVVNYTICPTNSYKEWLDFPECRCGDCLNESSCNTTENDWDPNDCTCTRKECTTLELVAKLACLDPDIWHDWSPTAPSCECEDVAEQCPHRYYHVGDTGCECDESRNFIPGHPEGQLQDRQGECVCKGHHYEVPQGFTGVYDTVGQIPNTAGRNDNTYCRKCPAGRNLRQISTSHSWKWGCVTCSLTDLLGNNDLGDSSLIGPGKVGKECYCSEDIDSVASGSSVAAELHPPSGSVPSVTFYQSLNFPSWYSDLNSWWISTYGSTGGPPSVPSGGSPADGYMSPWNSLGQTHANRVWHYELWVWYKEAYKNATARTPQDPSFYPPIPPAWQSHYTAKRNTVGSGPATLSGDSELRYISCTVISMLGK